MAHPFFKSAEVIQGVDSGSAYADLKVAVNAGAVAGTARLGNGLTLVNLVPRGYQQGGVVSVIGLDAIVMGNDNQISSRQR